jgi:titin
VTANNRIGESLHASLYELAASVPQKPVVPSMVVSTETTIEIQASYPHFDGGDAVTDYAYTRDEGPLTAFVTQTNSSNAQYTFENLTPGTIYRFKVAAINSIGQSEWSEIAGFYSCNDPSDPTNFRSVSTSETHITLSWEKPDDNGGCAVTGYRVYLENIAHPGLQLVYNGINQSTQTSLTVTAPNIAGGNYYLFKLQSKNCGLFSTGTEITVPSGSRPDQPTQAPYILSYDSPTEFTVRWHAPLYDGGFRILFYDLYVDNSVHIELDSSINTFKLENRVLGTPYKM